MTDAPLLGTHVSVSGGIHTAFERAMRIGCATMQVFTKNSNQWTARTFTDGDIQNYKTARGKATVDPVFAHAAYLINLCAVTPATLARSRMALTDELRRCEMLGLRGLIVHPGSHVGAGEEEGIARISESVNHAHAATPGFRTLTILETTAGQGSTIGYRFEQIRKIIDGIEQRDRARVCIDTCHLYAAGYPIHTYDGWERTIEEFDAIIGLDRLAAVHVNDSKRELGSRVDRHEHIGRGKMGLQGFAMLMNDPRFQAIPKILETDKSDDMHEDVENMTLLRSLIRNSV